MDHLIAQALEDILTQESTPEAVRRIEAHTSERGLWSLLHETGLVDVLLPEADGGAALGLDQAFELWALCGRHALPLPLPETQWTRAVLNAAGVAPVPSGPIGLGLGRVEPGQALSVDVSAGRCSDHVLICATDGLRLLPVSAAQMAPHGLALDARLNWTASEWSKQPVLAEPTDLRLVQALLASVQLSGAMTAVFEQTLTFVNQREQFGKPIGKFQAIQHNLSVMAEQVFAAQMAARLACHGAWSGLNPLRVAVAKARTSLASQQVTSFAHAMHGAIGFTQEFNLQLHTRRMYAWRQCAGAESQWQKKLGEAMLAQPHASLDLLRELTDL